MSFIFIISALHINSHYTTHHQLQIKNPDHHPSIPYEVKDVFDAAKFTLQGTGQTRPSAWELYLTLAPITPTAPTIFPMAQSIFATTPSASNLPSMNTVINAQDLRALLSGLTRTIVEAVNSTSTTQRTRTGRPNPNLQDPVQILLPSVIQTSRTHHSNITATPAPFSAYMASKDHQLSDDDRIAALEAEIYNFRSQEVSRASVTHIGAQIPKSNQRKVQEPEVRTTVPPVTQYQQNNTSIIQISSPQPPLVPENS